MHFIEKSMKPNEELSNVAGSYNEYGAHSCMLFFDIPCQRAFLVVISMAVHLPKETGPCMPIVVCLRLIQLSITLTKALQYLLCRNQVAFMTHGIIVLLQLGTLTALTECVLSQRGEGSVLRDEPAVIHG